MKPLLSGRPHSVSFISGVYVVAGVVGFSYHVRELRGFDPFPFALGWILLLRLVAIVGGILVFRGSNWGRWMVITWMAYHFLISTSHSLSEAAMHAAILGLTGWLLFRPPAAKFFRYPTRRVNQTVDR